MNASLERLGPRTVGQFGVIFRVTRPGQLCHHVEATAADGARAAADSCVTADPAAIGARAGHSRDAHRPEHDGHAAAVSPVGRAAGDSRVSGPTTSTVGKSVVFTAEITNRGQQPITDVVVSQQADAALAVTQATEGLCSKGNDWVWSVAVCPARQAHSACRCSATASSREGLLPFFRDAGQWPVSRWSGLPGNRRGGSARQPAPPPPLRRPQSPGGWTCTVDNFNKVTAGKNQQFLVQVTNQGDYAENDIVVTARIPPGSAVDFGTSGPSADIKFEKEPGTGSLQSRWPNCRPRRRSTIGSWSRHRMPGPITLQVEATSRRQTQPAGGRENR